MQTSEPRLLLRDLIAQLSSRGHELLTELRDPAQLADSLPVTGARIIEWADESHLVFCKNGNDGLVDKLLQSRSRFVVTEPDVFSSLPSDFVRQRVCLLTSQPRLLLAMLLAPFRRPPSVVCQRDAVHPEAQIAPDVILAPGVVIGPNVEIQSGCVIGPNTVIDYAAVGKDTHIGSNCTIGGDGFGYEVDEANGEIVQFPHFGWVRIGACAEIGANVTIDRGSLRDTILEEDVKVDNLVYIAHNCHIERGVLLMARTCVMGSAKIGAYAWIAPSTSIRNGVTIGRCALTGMGAVVVKPVGENEVVVGIPARKMRDRFAPDSPLLAIQLATVNE